MNINIINQTTREEGQINKLTRQRITFTDREKQIISQMRKGGFGYGEIAKRIGRKKGSVGSYCRDNDLGGFRATQQSDVDDITRTHPEVVKMMKSPHRADGLTYGS